MPPANAAVKFGFEEVSGWLAASAELVPAEKYTYKPVGTVRSFGELMAHAPPTADGYCWAAPRRPRTSSGAMPWKRAGPTKPSWWPR